MLPELPLCYEGTESGEIIIMSLGVLLLAQLANCGMEETNSTIEESSRQDHQLPYLSTVSRFQLICCCKPLHMEFEFKNHFLRL